MTARWHLPDPGVVTAVKATEPCPCPDPIHPRGPDGSPLASWDQCPTCGDALVLDRAVPSLVGGWLTLPWPVEAGWRIEMVEEEKRYASRRGPFWAPADFGYGDENFTGERRQAHFATVTAGEVLPIQADERGRFTGYPDGVDALVEIVGADAYVWRRGQKLSGIEKPWPEGLAPGRWAVRVASVVLHDPPRTTMPCPTCTGLARLSPEMRDMLPDHGCSGTVPLSVTDGEVAS